MLNSSVVKLSVFAVLTALAVNLFYPNLFRREPPVAITINATYDFIVVGGGAAGSTLAARLSENQDVTVLLLEAGPSDWGNPIFEIPALSMLALDSDVDWAYTTERQEGLFKGMKDERSVWPRGKVLGGSGNINAMVAVRGNQHDYDRWAEYTGDQTWNYRHVLSYFKKMEDMRVEGIRDSAYHGKDGPLTINWINSGPLAQKLVEAGQDLGFSNKDYNGKSMEGTGKENEEKDEEEEKRKQEEEKVDERNEKEEEIEEEEKQRVQEKEEVEKEKGEQEEEEEE
ncbi:oxygen-dependent choline dehydrogenase [Plakobranchus ocellatus]|uniref:Oxygen-dependent choline dehydrogenase n=1 Tax=Plakobranchus ocellatus TaxID=259542 RepID=A0AAV4A5W8_9GAST|nr:oxygen-dependent choline dehydrogenase [Plakobranchus ocellatus]